MVALVATRHPQLPYALSGHGLSTNTSRYKLLAANEKLCYYFRCQLWIILPNIITLTKKKKKKKKKKGGNSLKKKKRRNEKKKYRKDPKEKDQRQKNKDK